MNAAQAAELLGVDEFPSGWTFTPVHRRGELAGFFCTQGPEIHCWRRPEFSGSWLTRQAIEGILRPLIEKHGRAITTVRQNNTQGHAFVRRVGFRRIGEADGLTLYELKEIKHALL